MDDNRYENSDVSDKIKILIKITTTLYSFDSITMQHIYEHIAVFALGMVLKNTV